MKSNYLFKFLVATSMLTSVSFANGSQPKIGIVSIRTCLEESNQGTEGRKTLESMNKQMTESLQETDKQLGEITSKLNNDDFRDSLTPEAEAELQNNYNALAQERELKRAQFSQQLSQAQMMLIQQLMEKVSAASKEVASNKGLDLVLHEDAVTYFGSQHDITKPVIAQMNSQSDEESTQ